MLVFRLIFWGVVLLFLMLPGAFLVTIIGRVAGFRPGRQAGSTGKAFGWVGIVLLSLFMLGTCGIAALIDWTVATFAERSQHRPPPMAGPAPFQPPFHPAPQNHIVPTRDQAKPMPLPAKVDEAKMARTYLSDMAEMNPRVGWGGFGKKGKLGYDVFGNQDIKVGGKPFPNGISMHPPTNGYSTVRYRLHREAKLLIAWAALTDTENPGFTPQSPATFCVLGDDQLFWVSSPLQKPGSSEYCKLSIDGVDLLELQIHCPGSHSHVRGVWLEPAVLK